MTEPEFIKVKYRLAELVKDPGGMKVSMATERAARELSLQEGKAQETLGRTIGDLEAASQDDGSGLDRIYDLSASILDLAGLFDQKVLCRAAYSLCELTDRLRTQGRQDARSIAVHVEALRLIWGARPADQGALNGMVDGLWALAERHKESGE